MAPARKPEDYILRITAGPSYDLSSHVELPINSSKLTHIESPEGMDIDLAVRINNYRGLPKGAPETSKYFEKQPHGYNKDQYSISFRFTPKRPTRGRGDGTDKAVKGGDGADGAKAEGGAGKGSENGTASNISNGTGNGTGTGTGEIEGIKAADLQFGNDFDHPIRNFLPPGVNTAMNILKWWIDPGLEGDAYADEPFLYGPALSSFNAVRVGAGEHDKGIGLWVEEGASSDDDEDDDGDDDDRGEGVRDKVSAENENGAKNDDKDKNNAPTAKAKRNKTKSSKAWRESVLAGSDVGNDPKRRQKWALKEDAKKKWVWEYGRTYAVDFYNPYIDFGKCELKLPGFGVNVLRYWDGETGLRYVLRNRLTQKPYLVILFTLYPNDMVNEDGMLKPGALKATARASGGEKTETDGASSAKVADEKGADGKGFNEDKAVKEARGELEGVALGDGPKEGAGGVGATGDDEVD